MRLALPVWSRPGLSLLSGLALALSFPKANFDFLVWVGLVPLLLVTLVETRLWRCFLWGYLTGAIFFIGSCYWIAGTLHRYGQLSMPVSIAVFALFVLVFSLFFSAFSLGCGWLARRSQLLALAAAPFLWVACELARTHLITGFPWNLLGYAVPFSGLRQIATLSGVYGLSFLAVTTNVLVAAQGLLPPSRFLKWGGIGWLLILYVANWLMLPPPTVPAPERACL